MAHYVRGPGGLLIPEEASQASAPSGFGRFWAGSDGKPYYTNDAGTTTDLSASAGGGADPWTYQVLNVSYVNSTVTASDVFAGFVPAANTRYIVDVLASVGSVAATTGVQTALAGPTTGISRAAVKIVSAASATADKIDHLALNAFQVATAGLVTPNLLTLQAIVETGNPVGAGNIRFQARAEIAGTNAVVVLPGSSMRWRSIS